MTREAVVIFDEELAPVQGANLEKALKIRVMDRAEVILDIFSTRARSAEAELQVELAQLQYMLPRLARMWTHHSRIRGGIGLRGPGRAWTRSRRRWRFGRGRRNRGGGADGADGGVEGEALRGLTQRGVRHFLTACSIAAASIPCRCRRKFCEPTSEANPPRSPIR